MLLPGAIFNFVEIVLIRKGEDKCRGKGCRFGKKKNLVHFLSGETSIFIV